MNNQELHYAWVCIFDPAPSPISMFGVRTQGCRSHGNLEVDGLLRDIVFVCYLFVSPCVFMRSARSSSKMEVKLKQWNCGGADGLAATRAPILQNVFS